MPGSRPSWATLGLDLTSLRLFIATVEEYSITKAAAREGIAASAVSRRISELEARSGVALLERHERGIEPTAAGRRLVEQLSSVFNVLDAIAIDLDGVKGGRLGTERLHTHMSAGSVGLPELLSTFMAANPGIQLEVDELTSTEVMHSVQTGMADLGLVSGTLPAGDLHFIPWREDELVALLPQGHALNRAPSLKFADLLGDFFVGMQRDSALIQLYRHHAKALGQKLLERVHATSFESVRKMVAAGMGVAILPRSAAEPYADARSVTVIALDEHWARRPLMV